MGDKSHKQECSSDVAQSRRQFVALSFSTGVVFLAAKTLALLNLTPSAHVDQWNIPSSIDLKLGGSFDLKSTLPSQKMIDQNGFFSVDPSGPPLPRGVSLNSNGTLQLDLSAEECTVEGVIFNYNS